jgi:hypothetical protein
MSIAVTLAALLGTWACTVTELPDNRFNYVFARDGRGRLLRADRDGDVLSDEHFTYSVKPGAPYVLKHSGADLIRDNISVRDGVLDDNGYLYWHDGQWAAPSSQYRYHCVRQR